MMESPSSAGDSLPSSRTSAMDSLESSVALVSIKNGRYYILAKNGLRRHVQIIGIDPVSGALRFSQTYGRDMFPTLAQALEYLKHEGPLEILASGKHVLGYVVVGHVGLLLLVEKTRVAATLPGKHQVKTVVASRWTKIPLQNPQLLAMAQGGTPLDPESLMSAAQREEFNRGVDKITTFPVDGAHYFCETIDLTRPFPSYRSAQEPSWEFVWNKWLTISFRSIGMDKICPALLQGLCEERTLADFDAAPYSIVLISRRCRLHVGPRYKARGLNDTSDPANEVEVEQVIWRRTAKEGQPINWSRYTWRRGSVPLWWGVHMRNNGLGEAEIKIKENCTFRGSRKYVRRLQKRYCPNPMLDPEEDESQPLLASEPLCQTHSTNGAGLQPSGSSSQHGSTVTRQDSSQDPSLRVPLMFVSLLRKGTPDRDRSEAKLAAAFDFMANAVKKEHNIPLQYIALDWHELDKQLGSHELVAAFWSIVQEFLPMHKFALGTLTKVAPDHYDLSQAGMEPPPEPSGITERCVSPAGVGWQARWFRQQTGIARYNCADSLDRTNVGSFFGAVQVMVEQCRELDIAIAVAPRGVGSIVSVMKKQQQAAAAATHSKPTVPPRPSSNTIQRSSVPVHIKELHGNGSNSGVQQSGGSFSGLTSQFDKLGKLFTEFKSPKVNSSSGAHGQSDNSTHFGSMPDLNTVSAPLSGSGHFSRSAAASPAQSLVHPARPASPTVNAQAVLDEIARTLPPGWEVKIDNASEKLFYVDHNERKTAWTHPTLTQAAVEELSKRANAAAVSQAAALASSLPGTSALISTASSMHGGVSPGHHRLSSTSRGVGDSLDLTSTAERLRLADGERDAVEPLSPWCMLKSDVKAFARRINPEALSALAELFLVNGDMQAWLYTGSQAMHSERILIFEPENSKLRKAGVGAYGNIMVGIKRRYNNVMMDTDRQQQIEMFLGIRHAVYFPMTKLYYKEEPVIPLDFPESDDEDEYLSCIDWAPDKSVHGGFLPSGTPGQGLPETANGVAHPGHSRSRNKSYNSTDLLWDKLSQTPGRLTAHIRGISTAAISGTPASLIPGGGNTQAGQSVMTTGSYEDICHMHKTVSDPSMLNVMGDVSDSQSETSNQQLHHPAGAGVRSLLSKTSIGRSASLGNLQIADNANNNQNHPHNNHLPSGMQPHSQYHRSDMSHHAVDHSLQGHRQSESDMQYSTSSGQLYTLPEQAYAPNTAMTERSASGLSLASSSGTPLDNGLGNVATRTPSVGQAIKHGLKMIKDPLGIL